MLQHGLRPFQKVLIKFYKLYKKKLSLNVPNNFQRAFNFRLLLTLKLSELLPYIDQSSKTTFFRKCNYMSPNRPNLISVQPPSKKQRTLKILRKVYFFMVVFLIKYESSNTDFNITQKIRQIFFNFRQLKLDIFCEITGRRICYFVSPKFFIGHPY